MLSIEILVSLRSTNKGPVDLSPVRELLLTDAQFLPPSPDVLCENAPELKWGARSGLIEWPLLAPPVSRGHWILTASYGPRATRAAAPKSYE